jgi:hypothetical protein
LIYPFHTGFEISLAQIELNMKMFIPKPFLSCLFLLLATVGRSQTDVLQQHNDAGRTGWNPNETILNTSNVTPTNFGLLYKYAVDDQVLAQPLIASAVSVKDPLSGLQVTRNLLIIVTVKNTMYAFDADDGTLEPYWKINFTPVGEIAPNAADVHSDLCITGYTDFKASGNGYGQIGSYGTVGTPVIDRTTNTIYFVSRYRDMTVDNAPRGGTHNLGPDWSSAGFYTQFHALNLADGSDKFGSPVFIDATTTVNGTGPGNVGNKVSFDPRRNNQRPGLFISNGVVYISFSSHCDMDNYFGWMLGYKTTDITQQLIKYVTTPNDGRGGIWMSGAAPAVDAAGNIYFATGNGTNASDAADPDNMALSVVKTTPDLVNKTLKNVSWYKAKSSTYDAWNISDLDFGTGVVLIPGTNMMVTAHKAGRLYLLPQSIPAPGGEYNETTNPTLVSSYDLGAGGNAQSHSSLTYFGGATNKYIYQFSENTHLMAFPVNANSLGTPIQNTSVPINTIMEGGYHSVSSNGTDPASAILWVTNLTGTTGGTLHALKADDITQELWNSDGNPSDVLGNYAKMSPPSIANGKVYVATFTNTVNVYGLLANNSRCVDNVALNKYVSSGSIIAGDLTPPPYAVDGLPTRWARTGKPFIFVDLGGRYDICKVSIQWNNVNDFAHGFNLDITDDTLGTWTTINSVPDNDFPTGQPFINVFNEHVTARYVRVQVTTSGVFGNSIVEFQVFGSPANNCISPAVPTVPVTNITETSATLNWNPVPGVTNYIVKYKRQTISSFITRQVLDLSGSSNPLSINISGLACGAGYDFDILSDCGNGKFSNQNLKSFQTSDCSSPCPGLTRWYSADLGDVLTAGTTCYSEPIPGDKTFTVTGYGTGLGSGVDQFQFNYSSLLADQEFIARVASQDPTPVNNQAGIMMRDSLTDISRFIFVGKTGDNRLVLIYRNAPGATAVSQIVANPTNADFFRIVKVNNSYSAFYGISISGPWTPFGAAIDLGFGAQAAYLGLAVSSTNSISGSTATFKNFDGTSIPLPIKLMNFAISNENNNDVKLTWQTAFEENNKLFVILRGTDESKLDSIGHILSNGTSSITQSYSFVDNYPAKGINYYRLKQIDTDGHYTNSEILSVKFGVGSDPIVYPNPVNDVFTAVPGKEIIREIVIYDIQGRAVQFVMGNSTDAPLKVNISYLPKGMYILKIKTDSQVFQTKILKN